METFTKENKRTKVIIIGGGFGGINAAKALKKADIDLLLIDKTNHHLFQPLLYQAATAALSESNITSPIREILKKQTNATVLMANVDKIQKEEQLVHTSNGHTYCYDYLIVAPGARLSYFGHDKWEASAPGIKTVLDAIRIREHMLMAFEKAEACQNAEEAMQYLNFVIIGAGPTGVEMAGSIAEFANQTLLKNFRRIKPEKACIYLIEGSDQVLPGYPPSIAATAKSDLEKLGVKVYLNTFVTEINSEGVSTKDQFFPVKNIVWAAGVQASGLIKTLHVPVDKLGRALVLPDLSLTDYPNVFVIGDAACALNKKGETLPGIAPVAIQQARYVAKLINNKTQFNERKPFKYFDKGMMTTIGRGKAVGVFRKVKFTGFSAWIIWCIIHIFYLISFGNRVFVLLQWLGQYISNRRLGRLILHPFK